jgi:pimeloyl-ACP methyl ester carboxylesterase
MAPDGSRPRPPAAAGEERLHVTPDGVRLVVRTWRAPREDRAPLVLLDGLGCDGYIWRYIVERFAGERTLFHMQYRGHGRSEVPCDLETIRIPVLVEDLARALDEAGVPAGVFIGHSMGVQMALEGFRRARHRVRGLALLCGSYERPIDTWHHAFFEGEEPPLGNRVMRRVFDGLTRTLIDRWPTLEPHWRKLLASDFAYRTTVNNELTPELIKDEDFRPYMRHLATMDMRVFARLARDLSEHSAADVLPAIDVPALVVGGGRDRFAPLWISEEMHRRIRDSEILRLVLGSHCAPIEEPRLVERALVRLLERVDDQAR